MRALYPFFLRNKFCLGSLTLLHVGLHSSVHSRRISTSTSFFAGQMSTGRLFCAFAVNKWLRVDAYEV